MLFYAYCFVLVDSVGDGDYKLIWSDEFDGPEIDKEKWGFFIGKHGAEEQYYTDRPDNSIIRDGKLVIIARKEPYEGYKYTSASLHSNFNSTDFGGWTYGKFQVGAKLPRGLGQWPAIWLYPTDSKFGPCPYSGEIDIMEAVGVDPDIIYGTIHCEKYNSYNHTAKYGTVKDTTIYTDFHDYMVIWNTESITFFYDRNAYFTYIPESKEIGVWPFIERFYMRLNMAIGGWGGTPDDSLFPTEYEVDYVRIFAQV